MAGEKGLLSGKILSWQAANPRGKKKLPLVRGAVASTAGTTAEPAV